MKALPKVRKRLGGNKTLLIPIGLSVLTVWLRLRDLLQIPPGLHPLEAELGLKVRSGNIISLGEIQHILTNAIAKIGTFLSNSPIISLRIGPAIASAAAAWFFYHWLKLTYGRRPAIVGTIFMATLPLALNLARFGGGYGLVLLFSASSLYFLTKFWQKPKAYSLVGLVVSLAGGLYSHPSFNWFVLALALVGLLNLAAVRKLKAKRTVKGMMSLLVYLLAAAPAAPAVIKYFGQIGFDSGLARIAELARSLIVKSSSGGSFNLAGVPLLNAFVGLMLILGLMVVLTRLKRSSNRVVLLLFVTGVGAYALLPGNAPFADRLVTLVIPVLALAAIGTDYLLAQWHKTFPINSAARQAGSLMLLVLMFSSTRHAYNQYFLAWRATTETKRAYSYQAMGAAAYVENSQSDLIVVGLPNEHNVINYVANRPGTTYINSSQINKVAKKKGVKEFVILSSSKDEAIDALAKSFPGGKLRAQNDEAKNELFLIYTVKL